MATGHKIFLSIMSTPALVQWVPRALFPGVKRPGPEADHSPPPSAIAPLPHMSSWLRDSSGRVSWGVVTEHFGQSAHWSQEERINHNDYLPRQFSVNYN
jgi:hypothetical protein